MSLLQVAEACYIATASGSLYRLSPGRWERIDHHRDSDALRSESGPLLGLVAAPSVGAPLQMVGAPISAGLGPRLVTTSPVVSITAHDPRA